MEGRCTRHPSHKQARGVCPSCLRERLSKISASSASPYSSDATSSSCDDRSFRGSPSGGRRRTMKKVVADSAGRLNKSRSMAWVVGADGDDAAAAAAASRVVDGGKGSKEEKKGGRGFWHRLLGMERRIKKSGVVEEEEEEVKKDGKVDLHSQTVKETSSARWVF